MRLLTDDVLERSGVVANCRMNRERTLVGSNGYSRDLGFNPLDVLMKRLACQEHVRWLDLCCGSGRALIEAAQIIHQDGLETKVEIVGVDLVKVFFPRPAELKCLTLEEASLNRWSSSTYFDLITCVHGLHYIGDKLRLISSAMKWLTDDGRFVANLDVNNFKSIDGRSAARCVATQFREHGLEYNARKKLVSCERRKLVAFPLQYLGADDTAGPNYTGQPAVDSYYEKLVSVLHRRKDRGASQ